MSEMIESAVEVKEKRDKTKGVLQKYNYYMKKKFLFLPFVLRENINFISIYKKKNNNN